MGEAEEVSLDFESFLHNNGTLYSCFNHHGNRVYVDETQVRTNGLNLEHGWLMYLARYLCDLGT